MPSGRLVKFARQAISTLTTNRRIYNNMATASKEKRVWAISDIHVDHFENKLFIEDLDPYEYKNDTLILAGDVTDNIELLEETLNTLKEFFEEVCFVPGNHDLWVRDTGSIGNSHEKFFQILDLCSTLGVKTKPFKQNSDKPVWIVPLFSWYSTPEDDADDSLYIKPHQMVEDAAMNNQVWMDNHLCKWPKQSKSQSQYFAELNTESVSKTYDAPVISFSHFIPRKDLIIAADIDKTMVGKERELLKLEPQTDQRQGVSGFNFTRFAGCQILEKQIRSLGSVIHVHGHQHRNRDREIGGVRYVSHCMGYPRERKDGWTWGMMKWKGPKLIWP